MCEPNVLPVSLKPENLRYRVENMQLRILILALLLIFSYFLGQSHCQNQIVTKQVKVVRYVKNKEAKILAEPHAAQSELLELMRRGQL